MLTVTEPGYLSVKHEEITRTEIDIKALSGTVIWHRMLRDSAHLNDKIPDNTSICSHEVTKLALEYLSSKSSECTKEKTCEMTRYTSVYKIRKDFTSRILILFESPEVEQYFTFISYGFLIEITNARGHYQIDLSRYTN